ncbi:MAG TPA: transporter [Candidatus Dormibacteraeota bacterium]|nr:transporter [Candidatus Dormibacteraeota bacterium]
MDYVRHYFAACMLLLITVRGARAQSGQQAAQPSTQDEVAADPARPTVSTPATLTPVGYLQFESGVLGAWHSPELSSQSSVNEVVKIAVTQRLQLLASTEPFARSTVDDASANGTGDVTLGLQGVAYQGQGARPTIAVSYFGRVYAGDAPDLDIGSYRNSMTLLFSADVKGFHYDTNYLFNEVVNGAVRRAQFGQTLSVSHPVGAKFTVSGEIWRFTQPFLRSNAVGNLWALSYAERPNLVLDAGFDRGLTNTSTRWELFAGFTYLLPHRLWPAGHHLQ